MPNSVSWKYGQPFSITLTVHDSSHRVSDRGVLRKQ
jgi:hypothetical protein